MKENKKRCSRCKCLLLVSEFYKDKHSTDGYTYSCKKCQGGRTNDEIAFVKKKRLECLTTGIKICKCCKQEKQLDSYGKDTSTADGMTTKCKCCLKVKWDKKREKYKYKNRIRDRLRKFNPEYMIKKRAYEKRRREHVGFRISSNISRGMRKSLAATKDGRHWEELVGYTLAELKAHLEKQFVDGMTWENYGKWHIDHKRPMCSFNITSYDCEDFKSCWALNNLRPLWAIDNQVKNGKWDHSAFSTTIAS